MNKDGDMAGLLALQHEVDTLLTVSPATEREAMKLAKRGYELDEDELDQVRVAHPWKNRYGASNTDHFFVMSARGLAALPPPKPIVVDVSPRLGSRAALAEEEPAPEDDLPPRQRGRAVPVPDAIEVSGQRLVRKRRQASGHPDGGDGNVVDLQSHRRRPDEPTPEGGTS
jgi:hypothetical protein